MADAARTRRRGGTVGALAAAAAVLLAGCSPVSAPADGAAGAARGTTTAEALLGVREVVSRSGERRAPAQPPAVTGECAAPLDPAALASRARRNRAPDPSWEAEAGVWSVDNGRLEDVRGAARSGERSALWWIESSARRPLLRGHFDTRVVPGEDWMVRVFLAAERRPAQPLVLTAEFLDAEWDYLCSADSRELGPSELGPAAGWREVAVAGRAPAGAAYVYVYLQGRGPARGPAAIRLDDWRLIRAR